MKSFTRQKCQIEYFDIGTDYSYENLGKCILKYMRKTTKYTGNIQKGLKALKYKGFTPLF